MYVNVDYLFSVFVATWIVLSPTRTILSQFGWNLHIKAMLVPSGDILYGMGKGGLTVLLSLSTEFPLASTIRRWLQGSIPASDNTVVYTLKCIYRLRLLRMHHAHGLQDYRHSRESREVPRYMMFPRDASLTVSDYGSLGNVHTLCA